VSCYDLYCITRNRAKYRLYRTDDRHDTNHLPDVELGIGLESCGTFKDGHHHFRIDYDSHFLLGPRAIPDFPCSHHLLSGIFDIG